MTTLNTITLPTDLLWPDEFTPRVIQQLKTSLDATPLITAIAKTKGLPITLKSRGDGGTVTRTTVDALQALAIQPGLSMTLILKDVQYQVMFRHHEGQALVAEPLGDNSNPDPEDFYFITLNLITV